MLKKMYIRKTIAELQEYVPGAHPLKIVAKLNANENPYAPAPQVLAVLNSISGEQLRLYPSATAEPLRIAAAETWKIAPDMLLAGNGSDDILTIIMRTFIEQGEKVAVLTPSYTLYETLTAIQAGISEVHQLTEQLELPESFYQSKAKVKFVPNPNAQTGTLFSMESLERLCCETDGIIVIDEAYALFAGVDHTTLLQKYDNLIITRTLSKAYSLAGLRIGFGISNTEIIAMMHKVKDSYNVNVVSQLVGCAALGATDYTLDIIQKIMESKTWFEKQLKQLGWQYYESRANFVLAKPPTQEPLQVLEYLQQNGYLVRHFKNIERIKSHLRFSIGTMQQMQMIISLLNKLN